MSLSKYNVENEPRFLRRHQEVPLDELDLDIKKDDYKLDESDELGEDDDWFFQATRSSKKRSRDSDDDVESDDDANVDNRGTKKEKLGGGGVTVSQTCSLNPIGRGNDQLPQLVASVPAMTEVQLQAHLNGEPGTESVLTGYVDDGTESSPNDGIPLEATAEEVLNRLEENYMEQRLKLMGNLRMETGKTIYTPLGALKKIGKNIQETILVDSFAFVKEGLRKRVERVELFFGGFRGVGEAYRMNTAAQMAALDLLMKLRRMECIQFDVPPYSIFPGWRIQPRVFQDLVRTCEKYGLPAPQYFTKSNMSDVTQPLTFAECRVGQRVIGTGESDLDHIARRLAACRGIECVTYRQYPLEYVAFGSGCATFEQLVSFGVPPAISEFRRQWMLAEAEGIDNETRGVDSAELEAMQKETQGDNENMMEVDVNVEQNMDQSST